MPDSGKSSVVFHESRRKNPVFFVKSSGKHGASHFFVALYETGRYNIKTRQAAGGNPMLTNTALNSILGLHIILVLVLVALVPKKNSAFGHARNKGATSGFSHRTP